MRERRLLSSQCRMRELDHMKKIVLFAASVVTSLALVAGAAISDQDRYTVKVPNGLAFSEFRGYELWQTISISQNGPVMAVILGNPAMVDAYKAGVPGNGKPFPDGAKMAKIHWVPRKAETETGRLLGHSTLANVDA